MSFSNSILKIFRKVLHPESVRDLLGTRWVYYNTGNIMTKEDLEARLKELEQNLATQQQQAQQAMANANAMLGAKEEIMNWLKKFPTETTE